MPKSPSSQFYTVAEAARALEVSPSTIWRWIEGRKLPAVRLGPRSIRIRKQDLEGMVRPARRDEKEAAMERKPTAALFRPTPEELNRRKALVERILAKREERVIPPLTTADLVYRARELESTFYDQSC